MPRTTWAKHLFSRALFCKHPQPRSCFSVYCTQHHSTNKPTGRQALQHCTPALLCYRICATILCDKGARAVHLAWNTTSGDQWEIYRVKMHEHTDIIQVRHQSTLWRGYFWWGVSGVFMPLEKMLVHAEGKKMCLLEGLQKIALKASTPSFCPDLPQVTLQGIPLCWVELGKQPQPCSPKKQLLCTRHKICSVTQDSSRSPNYRFPLFNYKPPIQWMELSH